MAVWRISERRLSDQFFQLRHSGTEKCVELNYKTLVKQFVFSSRLQISSWSLLVDSRSWKRGGENEVTSTETKGAGPPAVGDDGRHVSQQLLDRQQNRQNRSFWVRTHRPSERMERMKGGCPPAPLMCAGGLPPSLVQSRETGG